MILVVAYVLIYLFKPEWYFHPVVYALSYVPVIYFMNRAASDASEADRETVRTWTRHPFMVFLISSALFHLLRYALLHLDPDLLDHWMAQAVSMSNMVLDEDLSVDSSQGIYPPSLGQSLFRFIFGLLGGFLISALIVQVKRKAA